MYRCLKKCIHILIHIKYFVHKLLEVKTWVYIESVWVLKETIIQKLLVFEKKILRIFGPTKENQIWRIKINKEVDKLIKHKNIINYIKAQRLSWLGHV